MISVKLTENQDCTISSVPLKQYAVEFCSFFIWKSNNNKV